MKKLLLFLWAALLLSFTSDNNKSTYQIPISAFSVTAGDIDLDGDKDIIVGHRIPWLLDYPIVTILENINNEFNIADTIKDFYGYQYNILLTDVDNDSFPDIIAIGIDASKNKAIMFLRVFYNSNGTFDSYKDFNLNKSEPFIDIDTGDINADGFTDLALISNNGQFWGVIYNDGNGNFSNPEYFETPGAWPNSIDCGDINDDGRADIVLCRQSVEVFFSTEEGFDRTILEEETSWKFGAKVIDFDLDGDKDVLTYGGWPGNQLFIYENINNTSLILNKEYYHQIQSDHFFINDFNNDYFPDIIFQSFDYTGYYIYYNQGDFILSDSQFVSLPPANPKEEWRNFYCADMDNNGYQDIICVKTRDIVYADNLEIRYNDGEGNFVDNPISNVNDILIPYNSISAYPNPFQTNTMIQFELNTHALISINITNLIGNIVYQEQKFCQAGKNRILWDGKDLNNNSCPPGIYLFLVSINNKESKQIKIIKR